MGLFDVVKELIGGGYSETSQPSVAEITIISTDAVTSSSESQTEPAQR
jgi:hypothetical protein